MLHISLPALDDAMEVVAVGGNGHDGWIGALVLSECDAEPGHAIQVSEIMPGRVGGEVLGDDGPDPLDDLRVPTHAAMVTRSSAAAVNAQ